MTNLVYLLMDARETIVRLRRENELMAAQLQIVTIFERALLGPPRSQGMGPDVAWALQKEIEARTSEKVEPAPEEAPL